VPATALPQLAQARAAHPVLDKMVTMREELRQMWLNTSHSREQLAATCKPGAAAPKKAASRRCSSSPCACALHGPERAALCPVKSQAPHAVAFFVPVPKSR
jgi:hypothetical protein